MMLFEIRCDATEYDNDPRMPGVSAVRETYHVIADTYEKAQEQVRPEVADFKKKYADAKVETIILPLEELVICAKTRPFKGNTFNTREFAPLNLRGGTLKVCPT